MSNPSNNQAGQPSQPGQQRSTNEQVAGEAHAPLTRTQQAAAALLALANEPFKSIAVEHVDEYTPQRRIEREGHGIHVLPNMNPPTNQWR